MKTWQYICVPQILCWQSGIGITAFLRSRARASISIKTIANVYHPSVWAKLQFTWWKRLYKIIFTKQQYWMGKWVLWKENCSSHVLERDKLSKSWMMSVFSGEQSLMAETGASIKLFLVTLMFLLGWETGAASCDSLIVKCHSRARSKNIW